MAQYTIPGLPGVQLIVHGIDSASSRARALEKLQAMATGPEATISLESITNIDATDLISSAESEATSTPKKDKAGGLKTLMAKRDVASQLSVLSEAVRVLQSSDAEYNKAKELLEAAEAKVKQVEDQRKEMEDIVVSTKSTLVELGFVI